MAGVPCLLQLNFRTSARLMPSTTRWLVTPMLGRSANLLMVFTIIRCSIRCLAPSLHRLMPLPAPWSGGMPSVCNRREHMPPISLACPIRCRAKVVFLTDGPARKVRVGNREIILKHTTPRHMATAGRKSGTLIQALRHLGQRQVDDQVIGTLRRQLTTCRPGRHSQGPPYAPAWIADILRQLSEPTA